MRDAAVEAARRWGVQLGDPFAMAQWSYVAPAGDAVVKVAWDGDDESLHEAEALRVWDGNGAVRLLGELGRALLLERAQPGTDLSELSEPEATAIAVELAARLWVPARAPFRDVYPEVRRWIGNDHAALELLAEIERPPEWLVHGDFHHHNILLHGDRHVAIDPKPYAADREYDVPSFLWNPLTNRLDDRQQLEDRIAAFAAAGLDEFRIRAWTVIRGSYLHPELAEPIRALL
ncbi:MAG TPA: aminoglycoside phosphotransferase family protein [Gaiellaceae bacterium]|nr:aminoglycoside phosphotransferase family protein [Gaiellaceae bacterium]